MIWIRTHLLAGSELQHVLMLVLIRRRWTTHLGTTGVGRAQNHRLTVMNAITRAVSQTRTGGFAGELSGEKLIGG